MTVAFSYDDIPYESAPFTDTHPDHLCVLGRLFGLDTAPAENCRLLELGCSTGGNLIPMAWWNRESEFVGIDLSEVQVRAGRETVEALGLGNVRIEQGDIAALPESLGSFDYIIAHGVYSWVPETVRDAMLEFCRRALRPHGLVYVSHNVLPGWRMRGVLRDFLLYHTRKLKAPAEKLRAARAALAAFEGAYAGSELHVAAYLCDEARYLLKARDAYLYHEYLETINEPLWFDEFVSEVRSHGLDYVCDTELERLLPQQLPAPAAQILDEADDFIAQQRYLDFFRNTVFRRSVLCREDAGLSREIEITALADWAAHAFLSPEAAPDLKTDEESGYLASDGERHGVRDPLTRAALAVLRERYPDAVAIRELLVEARARLGQEGGALPPGADGRFYTELFTLFAGGAVQLRLRPQAISRGGARPKANGLAAWAAARGAGHVATMRHLTMTLDDFSRRLLLQLDGNRSREEITAHMAVSGAKKEVSENVDRLLGLFARHGVLA